MNQSKPLPRFRVVMASLDVTNGQSIQTLLRGQNDSKQSDEIQATFTDCFNCLHTAVRKLNRECFFLSLKLQVNSNPATCSYIPKDHEKKSSTVSYWFKVLTTVTCHKFSLTDYRLPAAFFLAID